MPDPRRIPYGRSPNQVMDLWGESQDRPLLVLIHGGFWRASKTLELMRPLAEYLNSEGWAVANLEYRGTGGPQGVHWPTPLEDVNAALQSLIANGTKQMVLLGHSAGGHLALHASTNNTTGMRIVGVVALAPVTDLQASHEQGLGEGAVAELMPAGFSTIDLRSMAEVLRQNKTPQLLVHGSKDERVPIQQSRSHTEAAQEKGNEIKFLEVPGADHFFVLDPQEAIWTQCLSWITALKSMS